VPCQGFGANSQSRLIGVNQSQCRCSQTSFFGVFRLVFGVKANDFVVEIEANYQEKQVFFAHFKQNEKVFFFMIITALATESTVALPTDNQGELTTRTCLQSSFVHTENSICLTLIVYGIYSPL
jgi:hypothetical protein